MKLGQGVGAVAIAGLVWVTACGSSSSGVGGSGNTGGAGTSGVAGSSGNGGSGGSAGSSAGTGGAFVNGGSGGTTSGASGVAGSAVAGGAGQGGEDPMTGGAAGEGGAGGAMEEGPQTAVSRITLRRQFGEDGVVPVSVQQPDVANTGGLWLVSSHLIVDTRLPNAPMLEWYGEVANFGTKLVCTPIVHIVFYLGAEQQLERLTMSGTVRPKQVLTSLTESPVRCLSPGERAPAYMYAPQPAGNKVEDSTVAVVAWQSDNTTEVEPDPTAPSLHDLQVQGNDADGYGVRGFIHAGTAALSSVTVNFYPRVGGLVAGRVTQSTIGEELPAEGMKEFVTSYFPTRFSTFLTSVEYFEATEP